MTTDRTVRRWLLMSVIAFLVPYTLTYLILSRQGYADADRYAMKGFYYFFPENTDSWRWKNYGCVYLFCPLNVVDRGIGSGRHPAGEPLWELRP